MVNLNSREYIYSFIAWLIARNTVPDYSVEQAFGLAEQFCDVNDLNPVREGFNNYRIDSDGECIGQVED